MNIATGEAYRVLMLLTERGYNRGLFFKSHEDLRELIPLVAGPCDEHVAGVIRGAYNAGFNFGRLVSLRQKHAQEGSGA